MIDIGDVSRQSGLAPSTLRYYEERGLIRSVGRRGLRRTFEESTLARLALIELGRGAGFTLDEIATMLPVAGMSRIDRERLRARAAEIGQKIRRLEAVREMLLHTASCPERDHFECQNFQRMLRVANKVQSRKLAPVRRQGSNPNDVQLKKVKPITDWWR